MASPPMPVVDATRDQLRGAIAAVFYPRIPATDPIGQDRRDRGPTMSGTVRVVKPAALGRKVAPESQALTEVLHVRVRAVDVERLNALAASRRVEVSVLVREILHLGLLLAGDHR